MKLIAQVKLQPTEQQTDALQRTMVATNRAANFLSALAWGTKQFRQYDLHHAAYYALRAQRVQDNLAKAAAKGRSEENRDHEHRLQPRALSFCETSA